jgi:phage/plasmid-like protein (TIGR03299 family)
MSHELATFRNGAVSFYSAREPAWHRLGTVTGEALTAEAALAAAHLDGWDVQKHPLTTTGPDGKALRVPGKFATVRRNPDPDGPPFDTLGIVGSDYQVVQNEEAFDFLSGLVGDGEATFETAGALKGGSRVFVTMRLPKKVRIVGDDSLDLYVAVATGHDGEFAFHAFPTPVRIVCQNTLSIALYGAARSYKVRHDRGATPKLAEARSILEVTLERGDTIGRAAREMLAQPMSERDFTALVERHFVPLPEVPSGRAMVAMRQQRHDLWHLAHRAPTQEVGRGTRWGAFNAIAEWSEWVRPTSPRSGGAAEAVLMGKSAATRQKAWDLLAPEWATR